MTLNPNSKQRDIFRTFLFFLEKEGARSFFCESQTRKANLCFAKNRKKERERFVFVFVLSFFFFFFFFPLCFYFFWLQKQVNVRCSSLLLLVLQRQHAGGEEEQRGARDAGAQGLCLARRPHPAGPPRPAQSPVKNKNKKKKKKKKKKQTNKKKKKKGLVFFDSFLRPAPPGDEEADKKLASAATAGAASAPPAAHRKVVLLFFLSSFFFTFLFFQMIKLKTAKRSETESKADAAKSEEQPRKSPRRLAHSTSAAVVVAPPSASVVVAAPPSVAPPPEELVEAATSVQFEEVEVIGDDNKPPPPVAGASSSRRRLSKSNSSSATAVKKKGRKKSSVSSSSKGDVKLEVAAWRSRLADSKNGELVDKIEELVDTLSSREPALFGGAGSSKARDNSAYASRVAALQRLCRRWLMRREAMRQPEARAVQNRLRVWDAFIASEKKYFLTLLTIVQKCMRPLMTAAPQHVTEETLVEIFGSLPEIKDQSKLLLSKLRAGTNGAQWISSTALGNLFLNDVMPVMKSYVLYVVEYPKRMQSLARLLRKVPELKAVIDKAFAGSDVVRRPKNGW